MSSQKSEFGAKEVTQRFAIGGKEISSSTTGEIRGELVGKMDQEVTMDLIEVHSPNTLQSWHAYVLCYLNIPHVNPPYHPLAENTSNRYDPYTVNHATCSCYM